MLRQFQTSSGVVWYPFPSTMRDMLPGAFRLEFRALVIFTSLFAPLGALLSAFGAGLLVAEADSIKEDGVDHLSEAFLLHLGQRGWALISLGYFLTSCETGAAIAYCYYAMDGPRKKIEGVRLPAAARAPSVRAAWPEWELLPHMWRNCGMLVGDFLIAVVALIVALEYDYDSTPNAAGVSPFENSMIYRMASAQPYVLWSAALVRAATIVSVALLWDGLNIFYILCIGRCGQEWDTLHGLPLEERKEQERVNEERVEALLKDEGKSRYMRRFLKNMALQGRISKAKAAEALLKKRRAKRLLRKARARKKKNRKGRAARQSRGFDTRTSSLSSRAGRLAGCCAGCCGGSQDDSDGDDGDDERASDSDGSDGSESPGGTRSNSSSTSDSGSDGSDGSDGADGADGADGNDDGDGGNSMAGFAQAQTQSQLMIDRVQDGAVAAGELADISPWRQILQFYRDPCGGCFVYGFRSEGGVRVHGYHACFATLAHNWWGALRMHHYVSTFVLLWALTLQIHTGHYRPFEINHNYTWPLYLPRVGVEPLSYRLFEKRIAKEYGLAPPPPPLPPAPPGGWFPPPPSPSPPSHAGQLHPSPPPPSPDPPPSSPPLPPLIYPPPLPPYQPFTSTYRAYPHVTKAGTVAKLNTGDVVRKPYPPNIGPSTDSSAWMGASARVFVLAEALRLIGLAAYWVGIWRNEASVPGSHTPKRNSCLRVWCP